MRYRSANAEEHFSVVVGPPPQSRGSDRGRTEATLWGKMGTQIAVHATPNMEKESDPEFGPGEEGSSQGFEGSEDSGGMWSPN